MDVYKTQVNIDLSVLRKVVDNLKAEYDEIGNRETTKGRSKFCSRNYRDWETDRKSTRLNSSHSAKSRMPSSA